MASTVLATVFPTGAKWNIGNRLGSDGISSLPGRKHVPNSLAVPTVCTIDFSTEMFVLVVLVSFYKVLGWFSGVS